MKRILHTYGMVIALCVISNISFSQIIVGPYTGIDHATSYTNPQQGGACGNIAGINASIGDADFVNGAAEVPLGWQFSGTWASGATYYDGPGSEVLLVSLHTYTEKWHVALRLSDGTTTAFQPYNLTIVTSNATGSLNHCGGVVNNFNYERPSQELDFASYVIPGGVGVIGIVFEPFDDGAVNPDPHGVMILQGTPSATPCDTTITSQVTLCQGDSTLFQGNYYNSTGMYYDSLQTPAGCDSILVLDLTVNPIFVANLNQSICQGDSALLGGAYQTMAGIYTDSLLSANGCDSLIVTDLTLNPVVITPVAQAICQGDSILLGGAYQQTAGIYYDTLATVFGCDSIIESTLSINGLPVINPGVDAALCDGDSLILNASGAPTIIWNTGTLNGDYFIPAMTQYAVATGTDANNCSSADSILITVNTLPALDAGPNQTLCDGTDTTLSATGAGPFVWNNGVTDGLSFTPPLGITIYTVSMTDGNGCMSEDSLAILVNANPVVDAGTDFDVCDGQGAILNGAGAVNYQWDNGVTDGVSFTPTATTVYTVIGTDVNSCQGTDQITITVNPLPVVDAGPDIWICDGDSVLLNASGAPTLSWSNMVPNGSYFTPAGTVVLTATGTDGNGCQNTDTRTITVTLPPYVTAGADRIQCENSPVILNAAHDPGALTWSPAAQNGVPFLLTPGNYTYIVTVVDSLGCVSQDSVDIVIDLKPNAVFSADVLQGCSPLGVTFANETLGNLVDCEWLFGDGNTATGCGMVYNTYDNPGVYDVTLMIETVGGCYDTLTYADYIYVEEDPISSFLMNPVTPDYLHPDVTFTNLSEGAVSYEWNFGDNVTSNNVDEFHSSPVFESGSYEVQLVAYSTLGCTDTSIQYVNVLPELLIYAPNAFTPDGDEFNQTWSIHINEAVDLYDFEMVLYNRWGGVVFESHDPNFVWDGTYQGVLVQDGTYNWVIQLKVKNHDEMLEFFGHVNVLK